MLNFLPLKLSNLFSTLATNICIDVSSLLVASISLLSEVLKVIMNLICIQDYYNSGLWQMMCVIVC